MPFARSNTRAERSETIYLWQYLSECLGLNFGQQRFCGEFKRARQVRNHIVHRSLNLPIGDEPISKMISHLFGFPVVLIESAAEKYPKACTAEPPESDDDVDEGTPGYEMLSGLV